MTSSAKDGKLDPSPALPGYADEQPTIREDVVELSLALTEPVAQPVAVFTGGQPGAGKSHSIVRPLQAEYALKGGIAVIDPDAIRPLFAQARQEMEHGGSTFSDAAYAASGTVAYEISIELAAHHRHLLRDGTLADLKYPRQEMLELRQRGYQVEVHVAAVYGDLSRARTVVRQELEATESETGFGRGVGREFHDKAVSGVAVSTGAIWEEKLVDRMVLYNSQGQHVFDCNHASGQWLDSTGKPHAGPNARTVLESHQHASQPRDLVDAANTWLAAREFLRAPNRPAPPSEAFTAEVERETARALSTLLESQPATAMAQNDQRLQDALSAHRTRPLQAPADAWRRSAGQAREHWPEHRSMFEQADEFLQRWAAAQQLRGNVKADLDPKLYIAEKMAKGEVKADRSSTAEAARPNVDAPIARLTGPER